MCHNEILNRLYGHTVRVHGENAVGTEQSRGVDLVVRQGSQYSFYEIKTEGSIRRAIREALSQLMEYAYWHEREYAQRLVIVSEKPVTPEAQLYLEHLRNTFRLPIYYQSFDLESGTLSEQT